MTAYAQPPSGKAIALLSGINAYSFGGFDDRNPTTKFQVTSVAIASNVATIGVLLVNGKIPIVGNLVTVKGTQTDSGAANVANVALTGVTINSTTGVGTLTYAATGGNQSTAADAGEALVPIAETAETAANGSGQQFAMQSAGGLPNNSRDIGWSVTTPSAPGAFTANLQVADVDIDSQYTTVDTTTAVGARTITGIRGNFVRVNLSGVTGGSSPTVIAKILV